MDPLKSSKINYKELNTLNKLQIEELINSGRKIITYQQLILDITEFSHPGNSAILEPYFNNPHLDCSSSFNYFNHSFNANLLLIQHTIGKSTSNPNQKCQKLYQNILKSQQSLLHESALQKINFSEPIYDQLQNKLTVQQKNIMTQIPKHFKNPQKIKFKSNQLQQILYLNHFWVSSFGFQGLIILLCYLATLEIRQKQINLMEIAYLIPFLLFGIMKWTLIQYIFHRFLLHYDFKTKSTIQKHLMHHMFPNLNNIIAVSVHQVIMYQIAFYIFYYLILQFTKIQTLTIMIGILIGLTIYDLIHYYCHFGPEIQLIWLIKLKRNHLKHHFKDQNKGFGVSNTFWDKVFGTHHLNQLNNSFNQ